MKKKKSLRKKIIGGLILFSISVTIFTSLLVCQRYYKSEMRQYSETAYAYARTAASLIDGDHIEKYVETGETDEHYERIREFLNATQKETDIKYYYVFVPYEDDLVYVWDAENIDGTCELGEREGYMSDESKATAMSAFSRKPIETLSVERDPVYGFIGSVYYPVFNSKDEPVALVGVDLSMPTLQKALTTAILLIVLCVFSVSLIAILISFFMLDKNLLQPIGVLTKSAREMVDNLDDENSVEIDVRTGDELETLGEALTTMDKDLREYIKELANVTAERERIGAELSVATSIQAGMLPTLFPAYPERKEFDLYASMDPAKEVGGDFYDFFFVDEDHLALVIADVSGKGVPAALFMMISKILIKNNVQAGMSPGETLTKTNNQLLEGNEAGLFVTVWLAVIDVKTGRGVAANAGHEHPMLMKKGGLYEAVVYKHSPAVATFEGIIHREHEFQLDPGDTVFVYTDGVTEATNKDNELFGELRLLKSLNAHKDCEPDALLPEVRKDINAFVADAPQFDDITMMCLKYRG